MHALFRLLAWMLALMTPLVAHAQAAGCVKDYLASVARKPAALGISASDAEQLVLRVQQSIGLQRQVRVIPCHDIDKASAWNGDTHQGVPLGDYIIYNPDWVREVIGKDQVQAVALFGHELGHLLNNDFASPRKMLDRKTKEADADHFAGCAVGKLSGDFSKLEDLLSRLRLEHDAVYPDRLTSIRTAKEGFDACYIPVPPSGSSSPGRKPDSFTIAVIGDRFERGEPGIWYELAKGKDDPVFMFQEKTRTESELTLYDESRNFYLRLPIPSGVARWRVGQDGPWTPWYMSVYHR